MSFESHNTIGKLYMTIGTKNGIVLKVCNFMECSSLHLQQRKSQLLYPKEFISCQKYEHVSK